MSELQIIDSDETLEAWDQMPEEPLKPYRAFQCYLQLEEERSIRRVAKELGFDRWQTIAEYSRKYDWINRAYAWDRHIAEIDFQKWHRLRRQLRMSDWNLGESLRNVVQLALENAVDFATEKVTQDFDDNGNIVITIHKKLSASDLTKMVETASKIQRLASGMGTEHYEINHRGDTPVNAEMLDALIQQEIEKMTQAKIEAEESYYVVDNEE